MTDEEERPAAMPEVPEAAAAGKGAALPGPPKTAYDFAGAFLRGPLPTLVDAGMLAAFVGAIAVGFLNRSSMFTPNVMVGSVVAASLCYLLASRSLRRCEGVGYERMFIASTAMGGGVMLFELFHHFLRTDAWRYFGQSLTTFGLDLPRAGFAFPILWAVLLFATVFVGARYMRPNRWTLFIGAAAAGWFLLWLAAGFPSADDPRRFPESTMIFQIVPPQYAHPRGPTDPSYAVVSAWGRFFGTVAKVLIGIFPATFFVHNLRRPRPGVWVPPDDLLAVAWAAVAWRMPSDDPSMRNKGPSRVDQVGAALAAGLAPLTARLRRAMGFVAPKFADLADLTMAGVIIGCIVLAVVRRSFTLSEGLLAGSLVGFAFSYLFASRGLRRRKELGTQRAFIALCTMVSSMWLFEIIFHYWGWAAYPKFWEGFLAINLSAAWNPYPLLWSLIMVSLVFVGARYIALNRYFLLVLTVAIILTELWKAAGFPVFKNPELWPQTPPRLPIIPLAYRNAPTTEAADTIRFWAYTFNTASKIAWCMLPGTLFLTRQNLGGSLRKRLWPPGPALKSLFMPWTDWRSVSVVEGPADGKGEATGAGEPPDEGGWPAAPPSNSTRAHAHAYHAFSVRTRSSRHRDA